MLALVLGSLSACKHDHSKDGHSHDHNGHHHEVDTDRSGKEYTSAYICPMHCKSSGSDIAGTCPVCKMDYVANKEKSHGHHGHDHNHHSHDHDHHDHDH